MGGILARLPFGGQVAAAQPLDSARWRRWVGAVVDARTRRFRASHYERHASPLEHLDLGGIARDVAAIASILARLARWVGPARLTPTFRPRLANASCHGPAGSGCDLPPDIIGVLPRWFRRHATKLGEQYKHGDDPCIS